MCDLSFNTLFCIAWGKPFNLSAYICKMELLFSFKKKFKIEIYISLLLHLRETGPWERMEHRDGFSDGATITVYSC